MVPVEIRLYFNAHTEDEWRAKRENGWGKAHWCQLQGQYFFDYYSLSTELAACPHYDEGNTCISVSGLKKDERLNWVVIQEKKVVLYLNPVVCDHRMTKEVKQLINSRIDVEKWQKHIGHPADKPLPYSEYLPPPPVWHI